ncbi:hypothetical protein TcCL_ESM02496, partial [Trypanosoma cruzi]
EKIAFSGLVERTLPSMTQWEYDEQLFIHTIDTLRSVVIETIGRVKGELYFFMTGVDSRKAVLEQHRERLRRFRAREQAIIAEAEERLQASLPGGNVGVTRPTSAVQSMSQGEGDRPQSPSRIHSPYRAGRSSSRSCSRHEQSRHFPFRRRPDNCKRSFFSNAGNDSCQRTGEFSSRLPSNLMPRQPGSKLHAGKRHMHEDGAVAENTFSSLQSTLKHSPEWGDNTALESQFIDGSAGPPLSLRKELVPLKSFSLSSTISALFKKSTASCKASQGQRQPSPGSFLFRTVSSGTQSIRSMGRQNVSELAEKLTVRNVRRELVSLKIRTRQSTVVARESVEGEALCSQLSPQTKMASTQATGNCGLSDTCKYGLVSAAGGFGMTVTTPSSFFRSSLTAPNPLDGTRSKPTSDETTLASVVGAKQAASVARIRRTCENTAQFYLHFNNMINADGSGRCTGAESQWYATGSMGFYERRAVATIKRSRQVAGFDLHHLSPITALERCVQWPSSRGAPSHTGRQEEGGGGGTTRRKREEEEEEEDSRHRRHKLCEQKRAKKKGGGPSNQRSCIWGRKWCHGRCSAALAFLFFFFPFFFFFLLCLSVCVLFIYLFFLLVCFSAEFKATVSKHHPCIFPLFSLPARLPPSSVGEISLATRNEGALRSCYFFFFFLLCRIWRAGGNVPRRKQQQEEKKKNQKEDGTGKAGDKMKKEKSNKKKKKKKNENNNNNQKQDDCMKMGNHFLTFFFFLLPLLSILCLLDFLFSLLRHVYKYINKYKYKYIRICVFLCFFFSFFLVCFTFNVHLRPIYTGTLRGNSLVPAFGCIFTFM